MNRPHVICHMVTSLDGKVTGDFLYSDACAKATEIYYQINRELKGRAFACGSTTMESSFTKGAKPEMEKLMDAYLDAPTFSRDIISEEGIETENLESTQMDYIADPKAELFAVAFDRRGRLGWKGPRIEDPDHDPGYDKAHIIEVLGDDAPEEYAAYLQKIGVSYIHAGSDIPLALEKLYNFFGIKKLLLEGGSELNGAFAEAGVIDEISLVVAPIMAQNDGKPLFAKSDLTDYKLKEVKDMGDSVVVLRYVKKHSI